MEPEAVAGAAAVLAALVTAGPAYLAARRSGRTAKNEGRSTREVLTALDVRLEAEATARERDRAETREDIQGLRLDVRAVREWQASHATEHRALRGK